MYIELNVSDTDLTFQKKDEAGVNIGASEVYTLSTYKLDVSRAGVIMVQPAAAPDGAFPPVASFPADRLIIHKI